MMPCESVEAFRRSFAVLDQLTCLRKRLGGSFNEVKPLGTYLELVEDKMMFRLWSEDGLFDKTKC
jgi:hypothetical protein